MTPAENPLPPSITPPPVEGRPRVRPHPSMRSEKARRPVRQLGHVIPRLLVAVCLVDLALRFVSIDPLTFRAWEALRRYRPPGAAFEPNRRYYNPRSYGDLASIGNHPELRRYRTEVFTTDALGFRNPPHLLDAEVDAILVGDSFVVGSGVNDDETLSSRLSELGGCAVYNAGEGPAADPERIQAIARRLNMRGRLVIRLYTEDGEVPTITTSRERLVGRLVLRAPGEVRDIVGRLRGLTVSPLQIVSERALKALEDDRILPNRYAVNVVKGTLYNGDSILFRASHVNNFYHPREIVSDYWGWLRDGLRRAHLDLLVVIVPGKYSVYRPFLVNQRPVGERAGEYLDRVEREVRAAGIPVLNLTPFLSAEAARSLERGEYLYWLDDIHWNARGIALAAAAIREKWLLTEASCGTPRSPVAQKP